VYLWFDRKHKRFYLGCHWGSPDDGHICSSKPMLCAYAKTTEGFQTTDSENDHHKPQGAIGRGKPMAGNDRGS
jgi:hypothetical protein